MEKIITFPVDTDMKRWAGIEIKKKALRLFTHVN